MTEHEAALRLAPLLARGRARRDAATNGHDDEKAAA